MSFTCEICDYNWGEEDLLVAHVQRQDCQMIADIRARLFLHNIPLDRVTGFEHILDDAGLEQWTVPTAPHWPHAPRWIERIVKATWVGNFRPMLLRYVAKRGPLQVKLSRGRNIDPFLYEILIRLRKGVTG